MWCGMSKSDGLLRNATARLTYTGSLYDKAVDLLEEFFSAVGVDGELNVAHQVKTVHTHKGFTVDVIMTGAKHYVKGVFARYTDEIVKICDRNEVNFKNLGGLHNESSFVMCFTYILL